MRRLALFMQEALRQDTDQTRRARVWSFSQKARRAAA